MKNLASEYLIKEKIADGSCVEIYKAFQYSLEREVVIKKLYPYFTRNKEFLARFEREAKLMAQLKSDRIVNIIDYGILEGSVSLVMEYIEGITLRDIIKVAPPPLPCLLLIILKISQGLKYIHQQGIVHRDIKPENILISKEGSIKLSDFGIAQTIQDASLTLSGSFIGTPCYMSPEQTRGEKLDARSDLFSLGVVIYELATKERPFEGKNIAEVIGKITQTAPKNLRALNPALPLEFERLVVRLLRKSKEKRFRNIREVIVKIEAIATQYQINLNETELTQYLKKTPSPPKGEFLKEAQLIKKRLTRKGLIILAAASIFITFAISFFLFSWKKEEKVSVAGSASLKEAEVKLELTSPAQADNLEKTKKKITPRVPPRSKPKETLPVAPKTALAQLELILPAGAVVKIDGQQINSLEQPLKLAPGKYTLSVTKAGFEKYEEVLELKANQLIRREVKLKQIFGYLSVNATPWAKVYIDNKYVGFTPLAALKLPVGEHLLTLTNPNYPDKHQKVYIKEGQSFSIEVNFAD
jgi:serine/threonine-protein kinase